MSKTSHRDLPDNVDLSRYPIREFEDQSLIFKEGDPADHAYVVIDGIVDIYKQSTAGPVNLAFIKPGQMFGELALIGSGRRAATAKAQQPTVCRVISGDEFERMLVGADPMTRTVLQVLSTHLNRATVRILLSETTDLT